MHEHEPFGLKVMPVVPDSLLDRKLATLSDAHTADWSATCPFSILADLPKPVLKPWIIYTPWQVRSFKNLSLRLWANALSVEAAYSHKVNKLVTQYGNIPTTRKQFE